MCWTGDSHQLLEIASTERRTLPTVSEHGSGLWILCLRHDVAEDTAQQLRPGLLKKSSWQLLSTMLVGSAPSKPLMRKPSLKWSLRRRGDGRRKGAEPRSPSSRRARVKATLSLWPRQIGCQLSTKQRLLSPPRGEEEPPKGSQPEFQIHRLWAKESNCFVSIVWAACDKTIGDRPLLRSLLQPLSCIIPTRPFHWHAAEDKQGQIQIETIICFFWKKKKIMDISRNSHTPNA